MCSMCTFNYQIGFLRSWNAWVRRSIVLEKGGICCSGANKVLSHFCVKFRVASCKLGKIWCCATCCILFAEAKTDGYPSQTCKQKRWSRKLSAFPKAERREREGGMLDKMVKQVVLYCVLVKCLSAGCVEQMGQGALLWILSVAVTSLPPWNTLSCQTLSPWQNVRCILYRPC